MAIPAEPSGVADGFKERVKGALYIQGDHCDVLAKCPSGFCVMGECCCEICCRAFWEGAAMLGAEDFVHYSTPCDSSSHCSFKFFSNAGQECYRSPGSRRRPVCLPCLRYHCYLCELPLCWEVVESMAPLEDPSYEFSNLSPVGAEQSYCTVERSVPSEVLETPIVFRSASSSEMRVLHGRVAAVS